MESVPKNKHKYYTNSWLHCDMFVFYDWPFPHVYFAKSVGLANIIFPFNCWLSFQQLCRLLWVVVVFSFTLALSDAT